MFKVDDTIHCKVIGVPNAPNELFKINLEKDQNLRRNGEGSGGKSCWFS